MFPISFPFRFKVVPQCSLLWANQTWLTHQQSDFIDAKLASYSRCTEEGSRSLFNYLWQLCLSHHTIPLGALGVPIIVPQLLPFLLTDCPPLNCNLHLTDLYSFLTNHVKCCCLCAVFSVYSGNHSSFPELLECLEFLLRHLAHAASHYCYLSLLYSSPQACAELLKGSARFSFIWVSPQHLAQCHIPKKLCSSFLRINAWV